MESFVSAYFQDQGNVPTNINDLVIDMWQDDKVFAEQQIAGLNPFHLKRVIGRRKLQTCVITLVSINIQINAIIVKKLHVDIFSPNCDLLIMCVCTI